MALPRVRSPICEVSHDRGTRGGTRTRLFVRGGCETFQTGPCRDRLGGGAMPAQGIGDPRESAYRPRTLFASYRIGSIPSSTRNRLTDAGARPSK